MTAFDVFADIALRSEELSLQHRLKDTRAGLDDPKRAADRKDLHKKHDNLQNQRKILYAMRTWPFGLGANLKYFWRSRCERFGPRFGGD